MFLREGRDLLAEPLRRCGDFERPRLATVLPAIGHAALVHGWRHHGEPALTPDIHADARLAGGRVPADGGAEEQLHAATACFLLDRVEIACAGGKVRHLVPPRLSPHVFVKIEIDDEDPRRAGACDQAHVVAPSVFAAVAIPPLEGEVGRKLVLQLAPLGERRALPLRLVLCWFHRGHDLKAKLAIHLRPLCGICKLRVK